MYEAIKEQAFDLYLMSLSFDDPDENILDVKYSLEIAINRLEKDLSNIREGE